MKNAIFEICTKRECWQGQKIYQHDLFKIPVSISALSYLDPSKKQIKKSKIFFEENSCNLIQKRKKSLF